MAYLRCPDCRLTARATAYYIHGDRCPRCLTLMEPVERFRDAPPASAAAFAADRGAARASAGATPRAG
jgi:phage FluMu protein Com